MMAPINNYLFISAHNAVVTCSVFAPNPNRILDQILRNTTDRSASSEAAAEAELQEEQVDHAAEDTRSEPTSVDRAVAAAVGARSKQQRSKATKQQPQHHVREDSILVSFPVDHKICSTENIYCPCLSAMTTKDNE